jgi:outer membrane protein assembly factor BamB
VRFLPTKMRIKSLAAGPASVFVGGYGGSSLAVLDEGLTTKSQYPDVPYAAGVIGEVEGSIAKGTLQYLGTYTDAGIFRYDTTKPWIDGVNPAKIATLGPTHQQDRPLAWATSGGRVFFGTVPRYGVLGGALGIIDDDTSAPRVVRAPVVDQSVVSLAASGSVVYGGTSRWGGLGATPTQPTAKIFAYDVATNRKLWEVSPASGVEAYGALTIGPARTLWAANGTTLVELDPSTGATLRTVVLQAQGPQPTPTLRNAALASLDGVLYLVAAGKLYSFDPATLRVDIVAPSGISTPQLVARPGSVLVPMGSVLQEMLVR